MVQRLHGSAAAGVAAATVVTHVNSVHTWRRISSTTGAGAAPTRQTMQLVKTSCSSIFFPFVFIFNSLVLLIVAAAENWLNRYELRLQCSMFIGPVCVRRVLTPPFSLKWFQWICDARIGFSRKCLELRACRAFCLYVYAIGRTGDKLQFNFQRQKPINETMYQFEWVWRRRRRRQRQRQRRRSSPDVWMHEACSSPNVVQLQFCVNLVFSISISHPHALGDGSGTLHSSAKTNLGFLCCEFDGWWDRNEWTLNSI